MLLLLPVFTWQTWDTEWVRTDSGSHRDSGVALRTEPRGLRPPVAWVLPEEVTV